MKISYLNLVLNFIITSFWRVCPKLSKPRDVASPKMQVHNFIPRLITSPNFKFLALVVSEFLCPQKKFLNKYINNSRKKSVESLWFKIRCWNCISRRFYEIRNVYSLQLVFELELFKPPIGISVFGSGTRISYLIAPKICTKNDPYVPHLSSKFQDSSFNRFKVIAFSTFGCRIRNLARTKTYGLLRQSVAEFQKNCKAKTLFQAIKYTTIKTLYHSTKKHKFSIYTCTNECTTQRPAYFTIIARIFFSI